MIHEVLELNQLVPTLANSSAILKTYARPQESFLAEQGGCWGVIVLPGGGYHLIAKNEGEPVALAFMQAGVQAFLLEYSITSPGWPQAFLDTAATIVWLRDNAKRYGISTEKIAVCGFSAGGHLAGCISNLWNNTLLTQYLGVAGEQARPDASILCYPVITIKDLGGTVFLSNLFGDAPMAEEASLEHSVTDRNPPAFLWTTATDDIVPVDHTLTYAMALRNKGVPFELHVFEKGPHALGLSTAESAWQTDHIETHVSNWHPLCINWLKTLK